MNDFTVIIVCSVSNKTFSNQQHGKYSLMTHYLLTLRIWVTNAINFTKYLLSW